MLQATSRELVKGTVPVLEEHGETLTRHFYRRMFEHNPELKHLFNQGHQQTGQQQQAAGATGAPGGLCTWCPTPARACLEQPCAQPRGASPKAIGDSLL